MAKPIAHYSASAVAGNLLFVSGQIGLADGQLVTGDDHSSTVTAQTTQCLENFAGVLAEHGLTLSDVAKCTVFMTDIADFATVNAAYANVFGEHRPARSAIAVAGLPLGAVVEIEGFARLRG